MTLNNIYNVGDTRLNLTKMDIVKKIHGVYPHFEIKVLDGVIDEDRRDYVVSNAKIEKTGFCCRTEPEEGILEVVNYYKNKPY